MSRNFFKKGPPVSPNMPPPAPMKLPHKGQPMPIDVNLLVLGNTMQPGTTQNPDRNRGYGLSSLSHLKPLTPSLDKEFLRDKHVLQSLSRPTHVDDSFYDKFERLDRDYMDGEAVFKERGGRIRSAGKQRPGQGSSGTSRDSKRPKSSAVVSKHVPKPPESFFNVAMSFDDETKLNTKTNSESKTNLKTLRKNSVGRISKKERPKSASSTVGHRPRSGKKSRERSLSRKRTEASRSRSLGSASFCSSRSGKSDKRVTKKPPRARKSRSRTRRITPRPDDNKALVVITTPDRKPSAARSVSSAGSRKRHTLAADRKTRLGLRSAPVRRERVMEVTSVQAPLHPAFTKLERKQSADKRRPSDPISAVKEANVMMQTLSEMQKLDRIIYHEPRRYASTVPKLKMVVAPTPTPLATLVRHSSSKMLMGNVSRV